MNKKLTHLFFAFILTIATLIPMFPQQVQAQTAGDATFASEQFNRRVISFNRILARAQTSMPDARILLITSVTIGMTTDQIVTAFVNLGQTSQMKLSDFILVLLISRSSNISVDQVVGQCGTNITFGQVITNLGISINTVEFRSLLFRVNGFMADLEAEISFQLGQQQADSQVFLRNLELSINLFRENFTRFNSRINNFRGVFIEVLTTETGLSGAQLDSLHAQFPNLSDADFAVLVLAATSMGNGLPDGDADFVVGGIPMDELDAGVLFKLFTQRGIPIFAFDSRLDAFSRKLNLITRRTGPLPIVITEINPQN